MKTKYREFKISEITPEMEGKEVKIAGWVHSVRRVGKIAFLVLRDYTGLIQVTFRVPKDASDEEKERMKELVKKVTQIPLESVVAVKGVVRRDPRAPRGVEIAGKEIEILNEAKSPLPLDVSGKVDAHIDTRLSNRPIDLRRPESQAVLRLVSIATKAIRSYLYTLDFTEVFTPKIIASGTEGGAQMVPVFYFGKNAFLAQSPQLYKELLTSSLEYVFEIAPAWRHEESDTPYHLAEFISVDIEMAFADYEDVMKVLENVVKNVRDAFVREGSKWLEVLNYQPPEVNLPIPRISYKEAWEILKAEGIEIEPGEDFGTPELRKLSEVLEKEGKTSGGFYFIVEWPADARPFYTKRGRKEEIGGKEIYLSESFDLNWKHLEISSGSTRIHKRAELEEEMKARGLNPQSFEWYLKWFDYGMPPHAGWGMGLQRLMVPLTGIPNVRLAASFPRDMKRLVP
ncbi:aspartyl-tRNA synthetase [Ignicoccus islandicus DSM 13165]|uniref:Aspartate--tRNA(Asp/Asn) ligase n=1 Tax=Ignicoccus islandicus DSM 13165 TaxID=940295 RepID=A0A0U3G0S1_9CREN|nr:aspartate--tRNA(Asn) ligase [Ignicoccus islandicus]ALU11916.1 aspartyl-tRNA synthetase [Ignicoccus islandicus DSM 13165]